MIKLKNISEIKLIRHFSILLSFLLCFNLSFGQEEELREKTEKEVEIEIIHQFNKLEIDKIGELDFSIKKNNKSKLKPFHSKKANSMALMNVKKYIFHCQLDLKGCVFNN